jgi:hypothetical protein
VGKTYKDEARRGYEQKAAVWKKRKEDRTAKDFPKEEVEERAEKIE